MAVGVALLAVVFAVTWFQWGPVLPMIAIGCVLYYQFGYLLPADWGAPRTPFSTVVSNLSIGLYSGIYGTFMAISANDVFLFMVFGGLLEALDGNRPFTEVGKAISRRLPGGSGLTTVVSSGMMGMVTGAAVSNVAICGTYTIPWMKRDGYPPETAAAIEATASTVGQLVPPVMGSVTFIMAALLAVPFGNRGDRSRSSGAVLRGPSSPPFTSLRDASGFREPRWRRRRSDPRVTCRYSSRPFAVIVVPVLGLSARSRSPLFLCDRDFDRPALRAGTAAAILLVVCGRHFDTTGRAGRSGLNSCRLCLVSQRLGRGALQGASIAVVIGTVGVLSDA